MSIIAQVNLRCVLLSTLDDVNRGLSSEIDAYGYLSLWIGLITQCLFLIDYLKKK